MLYAAASGLSMSRIDFEAFSAREWVPGHTGSRIRRGSGYTHATLRGRKRNVTTCVIRASNEGY
jgi:hypothetical protein